MKKLLFALAITALFTGSAFAQLNWEDNIGLYFDEAAATSCDALPSLTFGTAYLAITHLTSTGVAGWEVKITTTGGGQFSGPAVLRGDAINAASIPGEYIVGLGTPLAPVNGTVVLADLPFVIVTDADPFYAFLDHVYFDSMGNNLPAYIDGDDLNLQKRLVPAIGELGNPQLIANGDCIGVVDNEDTSFGNVKALFR